MKLWSRASSLGALVLVAAVCATTSPISASAAAPTLSVAPRNELTIVAPSGAVAPSATSQAPAMSGAGSSHTWTAGGTTVTLSAHEDEKFKVGTFDVGTDAGELDAKISHNGKACAAGTNSAVTIHEFAYNDEDLTSLAATVQSKCNGQGETVADVRLNSTLAAVRLGALRLGADAAPRRITFTAPEATTVADLVWAGDLSGQIKNNTCTGKTLEAGQTCTADLLLRPLEAGAAYVALTIRDAEAKRLDTVSVTAVGTETSEGAYTALATPRRVTDTRSKNIPLKGGVTRDVLVTGANGVPSLGVAAVVLNITVVSPTVNGYLKAYPAGLTPPSASSVNYNRGWTGANLVTVRPGAGSVAGKIRLLTNGGSTHVIVDVVGYYRTAAGYSTTPGAFGSFLPMQPYRLFDSRSDGAKINAYEIFDLWTDLGADVNSHTKALALNVTVLSPEATGYLKVWNGLGSTSVPATSTLNFTTGRTVPNMTIVPVSQCRDCNGSGTPVPAFSVANASTKKVHVIVDVVGLFDDNTLQFGSRIKALSSPKRILDTRSKLGFATLGPLGTGTGGTAAVRTPWTTSLSGNLTAAAPQVATWLTAWSAELPRPNVSSLNPYAGQFVANAVMPGISEAGQYKVYNGGTGSTNVLLDVVGTFEFYRSEEFAPDTGVMTTSTGLIASEAPSAVAAAPDSKSIAPDKAAGSRTGSSAPTSKVNVR